MRAVILDRDGVINHESAGFIKSPEEWLPIPGSLDAIACLCKAGFSMVLITNQSGLARGLLSRRELDAIHEKMAMELRVREAALTAIYLCPHEPDDGCACRKPKPGLFYQAARDLGFRLDETWAIGDSVRDVEAAKAAGAKPVLVRTGNGAKMEHLLEGRTDIAVYDDLAAAARALMQSEPA
jgi:D-glycero-D-manno-heptose 1,7-bisphosphate phosphatase